MLRNTIVRVFLLHVGFHTFWVLIYCVSLLGAFILIPLVGCYNAFVLGFLGKSVLASTTTAALLGYLVFSVTGLLSGWLISLFHPKSVWLPACVSLMLSGALLVGTTWIRYKYFGISGMETILPIPTTTGRADADTFRWALKGHSLGELPPYLAGKDAVIPLAELQPSLSLLPKDFQLDGGPYIYCNLPPQVWKAFKKEPGPAKYPVLWATQPDGTEKRLVVSIDLKTDVFSDELVTDETFSRMLIELESAVRKQTGDANFTLPK